MMMESETGATADDVVPKDNNGVDREGAGLGSHSKPVTRCCRSIMERAKAWRGPRCKVDTPITREPDTPGTGRGYGVLADPTHDFKEAGVIGGAPGMLPTTGVTRVHVDACWPANVSREADVLHFRYRWSSSQHIHSNSPLGPRGNC
jgi:hypothetical protein